MNDVQDAAPSASRDAVVQAQVTDLVIRLAFLGLFAYWSLTLVAPFFSVLIVSPVRM